MEYDLFISHASEDTEDVARPLAIHLQNLGLRVWLDEFELTLGDSLRRKIDQGLSLARYGVVILSPAFFRKEWPNKELDGLVAREVNGEKVVLPLWHNVSAGDILKYSPLLADKMAVSTSHGLAHVANRVCEVVRRESMNLARDPAQLWESEADLLARLRKQMLISRSAWELRGWLYELESYLAKYPHSPEARLLKDKMQAALLHAEAPGAQPNRHLPQPCPERSSRSPFLRLLILAAILAGLVYLLLTIMRAEKDPDDILTPRTPPPSAPAPSAQSPAPPPPPAKNPPPPAPHQR